MRIVLRAALPVVAALWAGVPAAFAATPVSPAAGTITAGTVTFVATVATGETPLQVQVSTAPTGSDAGVCFPSLDGGRASCSLGAPLNPGTYYWHLLYAANTNCVTVNTQRYCLPETHSTPPVKFVQRSAAPTPTPPATPPPATPPPATTPPSSTPPSSKTIARPTVGGTFGYTSPEQTYASASAVVHYVTTGLDAPPLNDDNNDGIPDYVQQIGAAADTALAYYTAHRLQAPTVDGAGPDGRPDIYVKHFSDPDLYGLTINPSYAAAGTFVMVSPHLDPSPKVARGSIDTVVSHELFHVVQYGYLADGALPTWVAEGSAVAMSMLVYPNVDDLTNADYLDAWLNETWLPLYDEASYCAHCYGGGLWWSFLEQADPQLLPAYFRRLDDLHARHVPIGLGIDALDKTMRARGDGSLANVFAYFSVALYRARMRPAPAYVLHAGGHRTISLSGLAAHYVPITVSEHAQRVVVHVSTSSSERPRVALILGGPKGRVVLGTSATFRTAAERASVVAVISSSGAQKLTYRIQART